MIAAPLFEEFLDKGRRAPVEVHLGNQKAPHPGRKGTVNENVIYRFLVMLTKATSARNNLSSLG